MIPRNLIIYLLTQVYVIYALPHAIDNDLNASKNDNSSLYRLPTTVRPVFYNITLLTNVTRGDFSYKGIVVVDLNVREESKEIVLHAEKLKIHPEKSTLEKITKVEFGKVQIQGQKYDGETQFYKVIFAKSLIPGVYQLTLHFDGEVLDDLFGFYRSSYKKNNQVRWMAVTQFSPTFARRAFPCMDEPGFKATFQLNIGHYSDETVTSNTFAESRQLVFADSKLGDYYITHFARTPRMSTYLVGWAVHNFDRLNSTKLHMWLWSRSRTLESNTSPILLEGPLIEAALETYTAMSNPVSKFEQVAVPDFHFSAMENWGMVTYREAVGLTDYDSTPLRSIFGQLTTQAHEYSHSYFGNLVTPSFWDVAWLKEGFATYFAYLSLRNLHEDWRMMEIFAVSELQSALLSDSDPENKRTMNGRGVGSAESAKAALDFVTYAKGASVIRMFADVLGEKPFRLAMNSYLRRRQYEAVTPKDLYQELELVAGDLPTKISDLFDSWANQTNYPLVQVSRDDNRVMLSQRSFDFSGNTTAKRWWIPITLFAPNTKSELQWLSNNGNILFINLPKQTPWYVVNPHLSGYYRVDYAMQNWQALIAFLKMGTLEDLPSTGRATLIDDAFNLARANLRYYSLPLELAGYLKRERDYVPWITASRIIGFLDEKLRDRPDTHIAFRRYVVELVTPIYEELTTKEKSSDSVIRKMHRELILSLACSVGLKSCESAAKAVFERWIFNETEKIPKHFKSVAYRIGIINGSDRDWQSLWGRFLQTDSYVERATMIDALASTKNSSFINELLEFAIQPQSDIVKQYRLTIVQSILNKNTSITYKYVQSNLAKIISLKGMEFLEKILNAFAERVTTFEQKQEFEAFLDQNANALGTALESGKKALKTADTNIKWISRCATEVLEYIDNISRFYSDSKQMLTSRRYSGAAYLYDSDYHLPKQLMGSETLRAQLVKI